MQAALVFAVKSAEGKSYEDFVTELKLKTSQSPFNSSHYNASTATWDYRVSINTIAIFYESEHDPCHWMNNLSGWKRTWKKLMLDRDSNPDLKLIKPMGEQAIVSL